MSNSSVWGFDEVLRKSLDQASIKADQISEMFVIAHAAREALT